jgi:hypothetical protein
MALVSLKDSSGLFWLVYPGDPLWTGVLPHLRKAGIPIDGDLVLPDELPRRLVCDPPAWQRVVDIWHREGDTPALRKEALLQHVREVVFRALNSQEGGLVPSSP